MNQFPAPNSELPLVVIVGPTASGKTSLAVKLAEKYDGEIICADSRTVYKGMDIGTAKPTLEEQARVPHWGLDLVEPSERFTAADFKVYAEQKIDEIRTRGHVPLLVGGSGLYADCVVFDYTFGPAADVVTRAKFEMLSVKQLHKYCLENNIVLPENKLNKRYLIRTIEQKRINQQRRNKPISSSIIVGIATDREMLRTRIAVRSEQLFDDGVVDEAKILGKKYGWTSESMTGNIYPLIHSYLLGEQTIAAVKAKNVVLDWRLAKRQLTWLKRNPYIQWLSLSEAEHYLTGVLATYRHS